MKDKDQMNKPAPSAVRESGSGNIKASGTHRASSAMRAGGSGNIKASGTQRVSSAVHESNPGKGKIGGTHWVLSVVRESYVRECRALWYEIRHTGVLLRTPFIYALLLCAFMLVVSLDLKEGTAVTASNIMIDDPNVMYVFSCLLIGLLAGSVAGGDLKDKVAGYEVMAGHPRISVYLSRSVTAVLYAAGTATVAGFAAVAFITLVYGFGDAIEPGGLVARLCLLFFPYLRMAAFLTLVAFVARGKYTSIVVGLLYTYLIVLLEASGVGRQDYVTAYDNLSHVMDLTSWNTYNLSPVKGIVEIGAYDAAVDASLAAGTIGISLLMTAVYLVLGYAVFRRDDLN